MYQYNPIFLTEDKDSKENTKDSRTTRFLSYMGANAAATGTTLAAGYPALRVIRTPYYGPEDAKHYENIIKDLKVNIPGHEGESVVDYLKSKGIKLNTRASDMGPHYHPINKSINVAMNPKHLDKYGKSIFAHEFGHSQSPMMKMKGGAFIYGGSKLLTGTAVFAQAMNCFYNSDDESRRKVAKTINMAGGISSLPMIAEEIGASIRGTKLLNLKGADRARAFVGVASYISLAFSPTIIYHVSERTRMFLRRLKKIKSQDKNIQNNLDNLKATNAKVAINK